MLSKPSSTFNSILVSIDDAPIGGGSYSEVYKVMDSSGKIYAKKVFNEKMGESDIEKEIKINKIISHYNNPYIIKYIDSGITKDEKYILFEFASKGELYKYIEMSGKGLSDQSCKLIIYKVLKGLEELHLNGICHRDLDPQNIFLDGERYQVKIADLGCSEFLYGENGEKKLFWGERGKPSYMAPEMLRPNKKYYGEKADIFSIGVLLFVLRTKFFPFPNAKVRHSGNIMLQLYGFIKDNNIERYWNELFELYKVKYKVEFDLSPQFKDLFIKMVAYNPDERLSIEKIMEHPYMVEISHANQEQFSLYEDNLINELNNIMNL